MTARDVLLRTEGLAIGFDGRAIVQDIDLVIRCGELWFLCGPNGAGKSCLLLTLLGQLRPVRGRVETMPDLAGRRRIGFVPQGFTLPRSCPTTVREFVDLGLIGLALSRRERRQRVRRALDESGIAHLARQSFHELSGGQTRRTMVARSLARDALLLLLDEPTAGMDPKAELDFLSLLASLQRDRRITILCVTHVLAMARALATHAALIHDGTCESGPRDEILACDRLQSLFGVTAT